MDNFASKVRTFDAFPKVDSQHAVRSTRGGFSTLITMFCGLLIVWIQIGGYLGGYVDHQFIVDDKIKTELFINLDMTVAMPCEFLSTNIMDETYDRFLAGELLNFEGTEFYIPSVFEVNAENNDHETPELDEILQENIRAEFRVSGAKINNAAPACHIFGSIPVNHVSGKFFITATGFGRSSRPHVPYESLNFSHAISEFSFGEFYPYINNPLDFTAKVTTEHGQVYNYNSRVVPTLYEKLGIEVDTNQYSLSEQHRVIDKGTKSISKMPGIFFKYDFEPIKLIVAERRLPFLQFVARLATIVSGLIVFAGYIYRLYEKVLAILFGKRYAQKHTERVTGGLLDKNIAPKLQTD